MKSARNNFHCTFNAELVGFNDRRQYGIQDRELCEVKQWIKKEVGGQRALSFNFID
jgi:hypothetical protein